MAKISDYLNELVGQRNTLVDNLNEKGITASRNEKFNTLIPKVLGVSGVSGINKKLYSFGVLSDVHIKQENDYTNSQEGYRKALTYYKENGMEFVSIAGDILDINRVPEDDKIQSEHIWIQQLKKFKELGDTHFDGDIYTCTGNHDVWCPSHYEAHPPEYTPVGMNYQITTTDSNYADFTGKTCEQAWEYVLGNPPFFTVEKHGDLFIFFSMYYWNYVNFCRSQDIVWLENILEANKGKRVFMFSHLPVPNTFDLTSSYAMDVRENLRSGEFNELTKKYPNVIWFSGHSHYLLGYEAEYENPNTFQSGNSMTMIHCSSSSAPREVIEDGSHKKVNELSEAYTVDVYEKSIVVKGLDLTKGEDGRVISIAQYLISQ